MPGNGNRYPVNEAKKMQIDRFPSRKDQKRNPRWFISGFETSTLQWLRTFLFGSGSVPQEMSVLGRDCNFVLLKSCCVKPHEARAVHVLQKDKLIFIGHILPLSMMLAVLAQLVQEVAFFLSGAEVQTDSSTILQQCLVREGLGRGSPFFDVEDDHLQALIQEFFPWFLLTCRPLFTICLALSAFIRSGRLGCVSFWGLSSVRCEREASRSMLGKKALRKGRNILVIGR
jgi:hypothetical protein